MVLRSASEVSADTDRLDRFAERSGGEVGRATELLDVLRVERARLLGMALPSLVESSELGCCEELAAELDETGRFVAGVSEALRDRGRVLSDGRWVAQAAAIDAGLEVGDRDLLDGLERQLVAGGLLPLEAAGIRAEVARRRRDDRALTFADAVRGAVADHLGMSPEEADRAARAGRLLPVEVAATIREHFESVAGRAGGRGDRIVLEDLLVVIDDPALPGPLRDAAYRVASDAGLFTDLDVAAETDLSVEPFTVGFAWPAADGRISRDDLEAFGEVEFRARVLAAWHPLVDTAASGYDLATVDSQVGSDDVVAFVADGDIPAYVRRAVFDVYADRFGLDLSQRTVLDQELAWAGDPSGLGGRTVLEVDAVGRGGVGPLRLAPTGSTGSTGPTGPAAGVVGRSQPGGAGTVSGSGLAAAAYVQALVRAADVGWTEGRRRAIAQAGVPRFVHVDARTGRTTVVDLDAADGLTPTELKAWVAHVARWGVPPDTIPSEVEPHPYLDALGRWRLSSNDRPLPSDVDEPLLPGQYRDLNGDVRWRDTNNLIAHQPVRPTVIGVDGIERWVDTGRPVHTTPPDRPPGPGAGDATARMLWEHWGIDVALVGGDTAELDQKVADAINKPFGSASGVGHRGELAFLRDALAEGRTVEIVANDRNRATPDFRVDGRPVEVKSTERAVKPRWFEKKLKDAGDQIKKSGEAGGVIHLRVTDDTLARLDWVQVERHVRQALASSKLVAVDRVEILSTSGADRWAWERGASRGWKEST